MVIVNVTPSPLVCIGTHAGFVVMAWALDPDEASSLAIVFTLSFFWISTNLHKDLIIFML